MATKVGFVGVGSIGRPMLERLTAAGFDTAFFARRAEVVAEIEATGIPSVASVAELAERSEVVVVCVFADDQVQQVCGGDDGLVQNLPSGGAVVIHTTCSPTTVTGLAEMGARRGVDVLDAPFSGRSEDAAAGTITLLAAGPESTLERLRPVVGSYCEPILHVGGVGDGQRVKLVNNALFGATLGLAVAAEQLAEELGLDPRQALEAISHCSGDSFAVRAGLAAGSARGLRLAAGRYIDKDVKTAEVLAGEAGTGLGLLGVAAADETDVSRS